MRQREEEIQKLDLSVLAVTFERGWIAEAYVRETDLIWPLLVDESRSLYGAYQMSSGGWREIWGPASWWIYAKLLAKGRRLRRPTGDVHQLGGDVLVDPQGIVRLHRVGAGPSDRPSVESLLRCVRAE